MYTIYEWKLPENWTLTDSWLHKKGIPYKYNVETGELHKLKGQGDRQLGDQFHVDAVKLTNSCKIDVVSPDLLASLINANFGGDHAQVKFDGESQTVDVPPLGVSIIFPYMLPQIECAASFRHRRNVAELQLFLSAYYVQGVSYNLMPFAGSWVYLDTAGTVDIVKTRPEKGYFWKISPKSDPGSVIEALKKPPVLEAFQTLHNSYNFNKRVWARGIPRNRDTVFLSIEKVLRRFNRGT